LTTRHLASPGVGVEYYADYSASPTVPTVDDIMVLFSNTTLFVSTFKFNLLATTHDPALIGLYGAISIESAPTITLLMTLYPTSLPSSVANTSPKETNNYALAVLVLLIFPLCCIGACIYSKYKKDNTNAYGTYSREYGYHDDSEPIYNREHF
jgi:hypothetical protein